MRRSHLPAAVEAKVPGKARVLVPVFSGENSRQPGVDVLTVVDGFCVHKYTRDVRDGVELAGWPFPQTKLRKDLPNTGSLRRIGSHDEEALFD